MNDTLENSHGNHHTILLLPDGAVLRFGVEADETAANEEIFVPHSQKERKTQNKQKQSVEDKQ